MLYSNHKENGLIRIFAVHRALAGLDGYRGCGVVKKEKRPGVASLLRRNMLLFSPRTFIKCPGFLFEQGYIRLPWQSSDLGPVWKPELNPRCCPKSVSNFLPFLHGKLSCVQPLIQKLRGPTKASGQLGVRYPAIPCCHFNNLPRCHSQSPPCIKYKLYNFKSQINFFKITPKS